MSKEKLNQTPKIPKKAWVVIILGSIIGSYALYSIVQWVIPLVGPQALSPARNLEGTWKTSFSVKFYFKTDWQDFGTLQNIGSADRMVTQIITRTSDENIVNIEQRFTQSNLQLIPDSGYTPDVPLMFYKGEVVSSTLTVRTTSENAVVGTFTFTTHLIQGTWDEYVDYIIQSETYTATNGFKLTKQEQEATKCARARTF